jgi:gas vesicle protein
MMNLKNLKHLDRNDLLNLLGLESKSSTAGWMAGTLGTFGVGLLVGAGLGLMLAPKPGRELRASIRTRLQHCPEALGDTVQGLTGCDPHRSAEAAHNKAP